MAFQHKKLEALNLTGKKTIDEILIDILKKLTDQYVEINRRLDDLMENESPEIIAAFKNLFQKNPEIEEIMANYEKTEVQKILKRKMFENRFQYKVKDQYRSYIHDNCFVVVILNLFRKYLGLFDDLTDFDLSYSTTYKYFDNTDLVWFLEMAFGKEVDFIPEQNFYKIDDETMNVLQMMLDVMNVIEDETPLRNKFENYILKFIRSGKAEPNAVVHGHSNALMLACQFEFERVVLELVRPEHKIKMDYNNEHHFNPIYYSLSPVCNLNIATSVINGYNRYINENDFSEIQQRKIINNAIGRIYVNNKKYVTKNEQKTRIISRANTGTVVRLDIFEFIHDLIAKTPTGAKPNPEISKYEVVIMKLMNWVKSPTDEIYLHALEISNQYPMPKLKKYMDKRNNEYAHVLNQIRNKMPYDLYPELLESVGTTYVTPPSPLYFPRKNLTAETKKILEEFPWPPIPPPTSNKKMSPTTLSKSKVSPSKKEGGKRKTMKRR